MIPWLVWSNEHGAYWRANKCGYTLNRDDAGRYSREDAERICAEAAPPEIVSTPQTDKWRGIPSTPPEICFPAPEVVDRLEAIAALLKDRV